MTDSQSRIITRVILIPKKTVYILHGLLSKIFPGSPKLKRTDNIYVETLGLAGLFLYLSSLTIFPGLHENGETMLIIAFLLAWGYWGKLFIRQPLFWLMVAFILSLGISTLIGMNHFPEGSHLREVKRNVRLCLFIPLAWWIGANITSIKNAFVIVCLGFIFSATPIFLDLENLVRILEGNRTELLTSVGLSWRPYSVWIGFLLLGVGVLGRDLLPECLKSGWKALLGFGVLFFALAYLFILLFGLQGRASWIAVAVTLPLGLVIRHFLVKRGKVFSLKNLVVPLSILMLLSVFVFANFESVKKRFIRELPNISRVLSAKVGDVDEESSFGQRVSMGLWVINNEPKISFFGWGPRSVKAISSDDELREKYGWHFKHMHLHSDYSAVLFRYGIVGFLILSLTVIFFMIQLNRGHREKMIPPGYYSFLIMAMFYVLIVGVSNITLRIDGFLGIVGGIMFASILRLHNNLYE
jgi:O-antigen ligase